MKIRITGNQMQEEMLQERWQKLADWHEILLSEDTHHLGADYKGWVKLPGDPGQMHAVYRSGDRRILSGHPCSD